MMDIIERKLNESNYFVLPDQELSEKDKQALRAWHKSNANTYCLVFFVVYLDQETLMSSRYLIDTQFKDLMERAAKNQIKVLSWKLVAIETRNTSIETVITHIVNNSSNNKITEASWVIKTDPNAAKPLRSGNILVKERSGQPAVANPVANINKPVMGKQEPSKLGMAANNQNKSDAASQKTKKITPEKISSKAFGDTAASIKNYSGQSKKNQMTKIEENKQDIKKPKFSKICKDSEDEDDYFAQKAKTHQSDPKIQIENSHPTAPSTMEIEEEAKQTRKSIVSEDSDSEIDIERLNKLTQLLRTKSEDPPAVAQAPQAVPVPKMQPEPVHKKIQPAETPMVKPSVSLGEKPLEKNQRTLKFNVKKVS